MEEVITNMKETLIMINRLANMCPSFIGEYLEDAKNSVSLVLKTFGPVTFGLDIDNDSVISDDDLYNILLRIKNDINTYMTILEDADLEDAYMSIDFAIRNLTSSKEMPKKRVRN